MSGKCDDVNIKNSNRNSYLPITNDRQVSYPYYPLGYRYCFKYANIKKQTANIIAFIVSGKSISSDMAMT